MNGGGGGGEAGSAVIPLHMSKWSELIPIRGGMKDLGYLAEDQIRELLYEFSEAASRNVQKRYGNKDSSR